MTRKPFNEQGFNMIKIELLKDDARKAYVPCISEVEIATSAANYYYKQAEDKDFDLTQARKDTTRPSNVYYGLNWGYRSDETLEKSLDTGDLLFFNYSCENCFTPKEVISCYLQKQYHKLDNL